MLDHNATVKFISEDSPLIYSSRIAIMKFKVEKLLFSGSENSLQFRVII